jgi:hypothetical protein
MAEVLMARQDQPESTLRVRTEALDAYNTLRVHYGGELNMVVTPKRIMMSGAQGHGTLRYVMLTRTGSPSSPCHN